MNACLLTVSVIDLDKAASSLEMAGMDTILLSFFLLCLAWLFQSPFLINHMALF